MHRIGGIEKEDGTGNISYDPENHEHDGRASAPTKIAGIANDIPPIDRRRPTTTPSCSCSAGAARGARSSAAVRRVRGRGQQGRARAPRAPEPVPARTSARSLRALPEGARARDEPRSALEAGAGRVPRRRAVAHARCRACPFRAAEIEHEDPGDDGVDELTATATAAAGQARPQGLPVGPGGPLVSRAAATTRILTAIQLLLPELGVQAREPRVRVGHRLRGALPVLHEHLRHALHPRSRARGRHRCRAGPSRPRRVGDRRRRRHALDRRQPPDPRAAPQREPQDPACSTTRSTASPRVSTRRRARSARSRSRRRSARSTTRSTRSRSRSARRRRFVARTHDMDRKHMMEMFRRAHEHQGAAFVEIYQNCNVFNDGAFDAILNKDAPRRHAHRPASTASRSASAPTASTAS